MQVSFYCFILHPRTPSYAYWHLNSRNRLFVWFRGLGTATAHMHRRQNSQLEYFHLMFMLCTRLSYHMLTDIWSLGRCIFVRFSAFRSFGLHRPRSGDNWLRRSYFISAFCTLRVCSMATAFRNVERYLSVRFCGLCPTVLGKREEPHTHQINNWKKDGFTVGAWRTIVKNSLGL